MKKFLWFIGSVLALGIVGQILTVSAAPYPAALGGTGTSVVPTSGELLIGNGAGGYTVANLGQGGTVSISAASGTITITGTGTTTTIQSVLNALSAQGLASYNSSTGIFSVSSSSLALGSASHNNTGDFLSSSTVYVSSFNTRTGAVTLSSGDVTTALGFTPLSKAITSINGASSTAQTIVGGTGESVSTVAGSTNSTTTVTNTGVTSFTGQGCVTSANSSGSVSLAVSCISGNQNILFTIAGDATGTSSGTTAITDSVTVIGLNGKALPSNTTGTLQYSAGAWSINLATSALGVYNSNGVLSSYVGSSCGGGQYVTGFSATGTVACGTPASASTYTFAAGAGESVAQATSSSNTTTTYTNTGVTSFSGQGCVTAANSTGTITLTVSCISANQIITFTMAGDATGTATGTTAITDTVNVVGLNGKPLPANTTGTLQYSGGAWKLNLATTSLGVYDVNGNLSSYLGSACSGGQYVSSISATGVVTCSTPASSNTYTVVGSGAVTTTAASGGGNSTTTVSLGNSGVASGSYTCVSETVASSGLVTVASNGTCGTSNVSTSTSNTWGGTQSFGTTTAASINGTVYVPTNFATAGCGTYSTSTDYGTCVMAIYDSFPSSTWATIDTSNVVASQAQWHTPINFNRNGVPVNFISEGGTSVSYGGTGGAITINDQNPTGHLITQFGGFSAYGSSSPIAAAQVNTATTTGVVCGGSNGCVGVHFKDLNLNGFGIQIHSTSNAYLDTYNGVSLSGGNGGLNGNCMLVDTANNSGERLDFENGSCVDPGNSSATRAMYFSDQAFASSFIAFNSFDDTQLYYGISNGFNLVFGNHFENSAPATYPGYPWIVASSSGATTLDVIANFFANDATASFGNPPEGIEHAVNLTFSFNMVDAYGTQTINNFIDHSINPGQAVEMADNNWSQNSAVNNWMQFTGTTYPAYMIENSNSYPVEMTVTGGSLGEIINGQQNVATFDNNGNWTFPVSGSVLKVQGLNVSSTAKFQATTTLPLLTSKPILGTDSSGDIIATTIPLSAANGGTATTTALGTNAFSSATIYGPGAYMGTSGSNLTVSSTLASSSVTILFGNATTTAPAFQDIETNTAKTIAKVDCWEYSAATTTLELYYETSSATSSLASGSIILSSLACGSAGTSTTSFTTSSLPINSFLFAIVSSTAGTPTLTTLDISATKL
jgi:hypothetical protein